MEYPFQRLEEIDITAYLFYEGAFMLQYGIKKKQKICYDFYYYYYEVDYRFALLQYQQAIGIEVTSLWLTSDMTSERHVVKSQKTRLLRDHLECNAS